VRDIQQECLPHPLAPFLQPLGMAGGTRIPSFARKSKEDAPCHMKDSGCGQSRSSGCRNPGSAPPLP
jgi:hypothetical protein